MKRLFFGIFLIFIIASCDTIEAPYITPSNETQVTVTFPDLDVNSIYRKVLLEEYTGHICTNCPNGHRRLAELHQVYGDTLIAIGVHAGNFAAISDEYPEDFTTDIGTQWYSDFAIGMVPSAVISRIKYNSYFFATMTNWQNAIDQIDRSKKYAAIQLIDTWSNNHNALIANAKVTILEDISDPVQLCIVLTEDQIIAPQLDGNDRIPDYEHNHVLRAGFNGAYGKQLTMDGLVEKDSAYTAAYSLTWNNAWVPNHCSIIAFLINMTTQEVLQAETISLQ